MKHIAEYIFEYGQRNNRQTGYGAGKARPPRKKGERRYEISDETDVDDNDLTTKEETQDKQISRSFEIYDSNFVDAIRLAMTQGYLRVEVGNGHYRKVGFSEENLLDAMDLEEEGLTREQGQELIDMLKSNGCQFKFKTNREFLEIGYTLPEDAYE